MTSMVVIYESWGARRNSANRICRFTPITASITRGTTLPFGALVLGMFVDRADAIGNSPANSKTRLSVFSSNAFISPSRDGAGPRSDADASPAVLARVGAARSSDAAASRVVTGFGPGDGKLIARRGDVIWAMAMLI